MIWPPGDALLGPVLVIARSAIALMVSGPSVAELLTAFGSGIVDGAVTVTVFDRVPVALLAICATNVNVAVPFGARLTVVPILPDPLAEAQLEPAEARQDHEALVMIAGSVSLTVAPDTALGPLLVTTMV